MKKKSRVVQIFNDDDLAKLKPEATLYRITSKDSKDRGLCFVVNEGGKKSWAHRWRTPAGGYRYDHIGEFPAMVTLSAREENDLKRQTTSLGLPSAETKAILGDDPTFNEVLEKWLQYGRAMSGSHKGRPWTDGTKKNTRYVIEKHFSPILGDVKIRHIRKVQIATILEALITAGKPGAAEKAHSRIVPMMNYAADRGFGGIEVSPLYNLNFSCKPEVQDWEEEEEDNARFLVLPEVKQVLRWLRSDTHQLPINTNILLEVILRTATRSSEACGMHKDEIKGNWWTIINRTGNKKNRKFNRVYLPDSLLAILPIPNAYGLYFPSRQKPDQPVTQSYLGRKLRRALTGIEFGKKSYAPTLEMEPWNIHCLRKTVSTFLSENDWEDVVLDVVLNHTAGKPEDKNKKLRDIYNKNTRLGKKQSALEFWNDTLDALLTDDPGTKAKVIQLHRKA